MEQAEITLTPTEDGSPTLYNPLFGEHYHSIHGAVQESMHIFIEAGLHSWLKNSTKQSLHVLEVGFGTGLNALLTALDGQSQELSLHYTSLELYPVQEDIYSQLHFDIKHPNSDKCLQELHTAPWDKAISLQCNPHFTLEKRLCALQEFSATRPIDLIYFDAFSPEAQEELWDEVIFKALYDKSHSGAIIVTYCAKGEVRRRLQRAGWQVERLAGPPGKREMLRGTKLA